MRDSERKMVTGEGESGVSVRDGGAGRLLLRERGLF